MIPFKKYHANLNLIFGMLDLRQDWVLGSTGGFSNSDSGFAKINPGWQPSRSSALG
jgi:hypothetical protein